MSDNSLKYPCVLVVVLCQILLIFSVKLASSMCCITGACCSVGDASDKAEAHADT